MNVWHLAVWGITIPVNMRGRKDEEHEALDLIEKAVGDVFGKSYKDLARELHMTKHTNFLRYLRTWYKDEIDKAIIKRRLQK